MEHFNPILGSEPNGQKFITCGEIMLRLTPPNYEKIRMAVTAAARPTLRWRWQTLAWTAPFSA